MKKFLTMLLSLVLAAACVVGLVGCGGEVEGAAHALTALGGEVEDCRDCAVPGAPVSHRVVRIRKTSPTPFGYPRRWARIQKAPL